MTLVLPLAICAMQKATGGRSYGYISAADSASGNRAIPITQRSCAKCSSSPRKAFSQVNRRPISSTPYSSMAYAKPSRRVTPFFRSSAVRRGDARATKSKTMSLSN